MADDPLGSQPSPELAREAAADSPVAPASPEAPASSAATAPDSAAPPSLDDLLSEYDASAVPKPEPQATPQEAPQAPPANPHAHIEALESEFKQWQQLQLAEMKAEGLTAQVERAHQVIDKIHFDAVIGAIDKRLSDFGLPVPEGYVRDKLLATAFESPDLVKAFDNRHQDPARYNRAMRKVQDKIVADARAIPNREATEDRAAVVHAMRSTTTKMPREPEPDYGNMDNATFQKELAKFGIHR